MPHLNVEYTSNLEPSVDIKTFCQGLGATLVALRNDDNGPIFPIAGTRVMAWPASYFSVADGQADRAFIYLNLRIMAGRSDALKKRTGDALLAFATQHLEPVFAKHALGLTLHIEEDMPVYEGKKNNLATHLAAKPLD